MENNTITTHNSYDDLQLIYKTKLLNQESSSPQQSRPLFTQSMTRAVNEVKPLRTFKVLNKIALSGGTITITPVNVSTVRNNEIAFLRNKSRSCDARLESYSKETQPVLQNKLQ